MQILSAKSSIIPLLRPSIFWVMALTACVCTLCMLPSSLAFAQGTQVPVNPVEMTDAHNTVRTNVNNGIAPIAKTPPQPRPTPQIPRVVWDETIAEGAGMYAKECLKITHCTDPNNPKCFMAKKMGENLLWWSAPRSPQQVVEVWAREAKVYDYKINKCNPTTEVCGHYTQLVWSKTTKIGCGAASCPSFGQQWVCRYSPGGNVSGEWPYFSPSQIAGDYLVAPPSVGLPLVEITDDGALSFKCDGKSIVVQGTWTNPPPTFTVTTTVNCNNVTLMKGKSFIFETASGGVATFTGTVMPSGGGSTEITGTRTNLRKACSTLNAQVWRDTVAVPMSWTEEDCWTRSKSIGGNAYQLGCYTADGIVFGAAVRGARPSPDCGWSSPPTQLVPPLQKACSVYAVNSWRDTFNVPMSWTQSNCNTLHNEFGANRYELGCVTANTIDLGAYNNGPPTKDCGWSLPPTKLVPPLQKACSVNSGQHWRDTINVPMSWNRGDCSKFMTQVSGTKYQLGCITAQGIVRGTANGGIPSQNCGW